RLIQLFNALPISMTTAPAIALPAPMTDIHTSGDDMEMTPLLLLNIIFCTLGGCFVGWVLNLFVNFLFKLPPFDFLREDETKRAKAGRRYELPEVGG
ncbi:MAG: hypothetical protein LBD68_01820, partial [Zoogloeaceae bacterium]|nr:hypothetical protein [Zoogloeaceae bacterium]